MIALPMFVQHENTPQYYGNLSEGTVFIRASFVTASSAMRYLRLPRGRCLCLDTLSLIDDSPAMECIIVGELKCD